MDDGVQLRHPSVVLTSFDIYESKTQFHIIGSNRAEGVYRVLCINRLSSEPAQMAIDDGKVYTVCEIEPVIKKIQISSKLLVDRACGILGLVRFTKGHYISVITKCRPVALLGGHYIYHVEDTRLLSVLIKPERSDLEDKFIYTFKNVDLTKNFYYSYTYDVTHTLQRNMTRGAAQSTPNSRRDKHIYHSMFVWNYQLMCNSIVAFNIRPEWTVPLIHGYVDQSRLSIFGRDVYITLIARRSRVFAGVRYIRRGVNDHGYVANDVETEQIVNTMELTSFDQPYSRPFSNPYYTSYVQHRGSIPLFWSQDTSGIVPKPPIEINVRDPYFVEAGLHFDNLLRRYGAPIIVLNLIKIKERTKRESLLGEEFSEGIRYLNQFLPPGNKLRYIAWDMSRAKKNRQEDVLAILEVIAEETLALTGFFHSGPELYSNYLKRRDAGDSYPLRTQTKCQMGIVRSNCIDCLDRTNAAQSIIGKVVLAHQLFELGQINEPHLSFNTDAAMMIEEMYHDLGDTIALQYGGSHLVNTVQTYRRNNNWRSHSRDIVESLRRYYSNSLLDLERQEAISFFLEKCLLDECKPFTEIPVLADDPTCFESAPSQIRRPKNIRWWATALGESECVDDPESEKSIDINDADKGVFEPDGDEEFEVEKRNSTTSDLANDAVDVQQTTRKDTDDPEFVGPIHTIQGSTSNIKSMNELESATKHASSQSTDPDENNDHTKATRIANEGVSSATIDGNSNSVKGGKSSNENNEHNERKKVEIDAELPENVEIHYKRYDYWNEYYKPYEYTSFDDLLVAHLNSSVSLHPNTPTEEMLGPFTDRRQRNSHKTHHFRNFQKDPKWFKPDSDEYTDPTLVSRQEIYEKIRAKTVAPQIFQPASVGGWSTDGINDQLQEPKVSQNELEEYEKYVHQFDDLKQWIVPHSTKLYSERMISKCDIDGAHGENDAAKDIFPDGHTPQVRPESVAGLHMESHTHRSVTPTHLPSTFSTQSVLATLPRRQHHHNATLYPRIRANTSTEHNGLWLQWSQSGKRGLLQRQMGIGCSDFPSSLSMNAKLDNANIKKRNMSMSQHAIRKHDRSRSLDFFGNSVTAATGEMQQIHPSLLQAQRSAGLTTNEPRISEADLKIYQDYIKMHKAFEGMY